MCASVAHCCCCALQVNALQKGFLTLSDALLEELGELSPVLHVYVWFQCRHTHRQAVEVIINILLCRVSETREGLAINGSERDTS